MKLIKAHGGRWGPGKVHIPFQWESKHAQDGITLCGRNVYGTVVDEKAEKVTCQLCIRKDHP